MGTGRWDHGRPRGDTSYQGSGGAPEAATYRLFQFDREHPRGGSAEVQRERFVWSVTEAYKTIGPEERVAGRRADVPGERELRATRQRRLPRVRRAPDRGPAAIACTV